MIPTFVFGWPTGKEKGEYLAVDLGVLRFIRGVKCLQYFIFLRRWDQLASMPRVRARGRKVRDYAIQIPPHRRTKARGGPKVV